MGSRSRFHDAGHRAHRLCLPSLSFHGVPRPSEISELFGGDDADAGGCTSSREQYERSETVAANGKASEEFAVSEAHLLPIYSKIEFSHGAEQAYLHVVSATLHCIKDWMQNMHVSREMRKREEEKSKYWARATSPFPRGRHEPGQGPP